MVKAYTCILPFSLLDILPTLLFLLGSLSRPTHKILLSLFKDKQLLSAYYFILRKIASKEHRDAISYNNLRIKNKVTATSTYRHSKSGFTNDYKIFISVNRY